MPDVSYGELVTAPERLAEPGVPTSADLHVRDLIEALRDAEAIARRYERAIGWWAARFESQVARAAQAEARASRFEGALDHTGLRAIHAEQELEAAEAALCHEHTPIFDGTERLSIAARIRWLGATDPNAGEPVAGNATLRGESIARS